MFVAGTTLWTVAGCTGSTSAPTPSASGTVIESPSASVAPTPDPVFNAAGTAADNFAYFNKVNIAFLSANTMPGGRAIIDNLVAAGFDRSLMQVTPDTTSVGRNVDSVQFSVRFGTDCVIGQTSDAGYSSTVGPTIDGTACLVGVTRKIDW